MSINKSCNVVLSEKQKQNATMETPNQKQTKITELFKTDETYVSFW